MTRRPTRAARCLLALLAAAGAGGALPAAAQISPGPLSRPHAALEGATACRQCHQPGQGVAPARCLDCHTALRDRIDAGKGLHARPDHQRCATCHVEHHGREFDLVFWGQSGRAGFDHRQTGFPLRGAHARQACQACHRPGLLRDAATLQRGGANPQRTFLGLGTTCVSCHRDEHRGQLAGQACASCHGQEAWSPAPGFDHDRTAFPLSGGHRELACASCHPQQPAPQAGDPDAAFLKLRGLAHESCASCHRDPHAGRMGQQCQQCHTTTGWRDGARDRFDHDRTGFPLTGAHRQTACASCHRSRGASGEATFGKLAHGSCTDCHRDVHEGRLGSTCQSCHSTASWRGAPARAGLDHDRTRFPLRGEHREVACQSCHAPGQALRRGGFESCASCHRDPHLGQLARTAAGAATCASCHTVAAFSPSTFTVAAHDAAYPLRGGHQAVACISCHRQVPFAELPAPVRQRADSSRPDATRLFRFAGTGCPTCHDDPHQGEVAQLVAASGCTSCHGVEGWRSVVFDHDRTGFALEGAHAGAPCAGCHGRPPTGSTSGGGPGATAPRRGRLVSASPVENAGAGLRFRGTATECAACHGDPHPVAATSGGATTVGRCADCHTPVRWNAVRFDRERHPRFPLQGAHRETACASCHRPTVVGGSRRIPFSPLPTRCEDCHAGAASPPGGG